MNERTPPRQWQLQEAKQRFSELVKRAQRDGPQVVTRHGDAVVVVMDINEYRHLAEPKPSFKEFLLSGPKFDVDLEIERPLEYPREIDLGD